MSALMYENNFICTQIKFKPLSRVSKALTKIPIHRKTEVVKKSG